MRLKPLIEFLKSLPQDGIVKNGFGFPMSYRGNYYDLAFHPEPTAKISEMLMHAMSAVNAKFEGYKGGIFTMHDYTECWISEYGDCAEYPIHPLELKAWADQLLESNVEITGPASGSGASSR